VNAGKTLPLCQKVDVTVVGKADAEQYNSERFLKKYFVYLLLLVVMLV
jgi:hypothetical protein